MPIMFEPRRGYSEPFFTPDGTECQVDLITGEVVRLVDCKVLEGSRVLTPQQLDIIKKQREKRMRERFKKTNEKPLGSFVRLRFARNEAISNLSSESLARLAYLSTYVSFDGQLKYSPRKPMTKQLMMQVMDLSQSTFYRFYDDLASKRILREDTDGILWLSKGIYLKGKMPGRTGYDAGWTKLFTPAVRSLYEQTPTRQHLYIGAILRLAPFVNVNYNLVCRDPFAKPLDEALTYAMGMPEICRLLGLNANNAALYREKYSELTFQQNFALHKLCTIIPQGDGKELVFVNPRLMFAGDDWEMVEGIIERLANRRVAARSEASA